MLIWSLLHLFGECSVVESEFGLVENVNPKILSIGWIQDVHLSMVKEPIQFFLFALRWVACIFRNGTIFSK